MRAAAVFLFLSVSLPVPAFAGPLSGSVVDASGRGVPRAVVHVIARDGAPAGSVFTEADGAFRLNSAPDGCRIRVVLSGFEPADAACGTGAPLRITLAVAPIAEDIVVSATRTDAPAGQVASAVTVFDAADIERFHQPLLGQLLRQAPGTTVVPTGAPGSVTSLFVRGGESNYTKVLLDGIPLNEPGGTFNFSNVTTENLERVEFVRGANSAIYGSDAMTGVIQLFTRRGRTARPEFRLRAEGGTFATARGSAGLSGKAGRLDYSMDAAGVTTDNDVPNNEFTNTTVSGSAGVMLGGGAALRTIGRMERGRTGTPGQTAFGRPDLDAFFRRNDGAWGVSFDQTAGALHQRASYGIAVSHQASTNLEIDPPYTPSFDGSTAPFAFTDFRLDRRTDLRRHHASYQVDGTVATSRAGTHVETALVDWDGERATLTDALAGSAVRASRDNVGVTLQHQALWARVFVTAGVRFEHNASFGNATVPRVAAAWYAREGGSAAGATRISASYGRSIKEPTILQSFSPSPFFLGNPDLLPERARAFEAGLEQRLAGERLRLNATWFDNRYRDIISLQTIDEARFTSQYFNVGLTTARGVELSGDLALVSGWRAKGGYTYTDSEIVDSTSNSEAFTEGNTAFRRPRHAGFVDIAWHGARGSAGLDGAFVGRRVDSDFAALDPPILVNDAYTLWNLRAALRATRIVTLTLAVDNLAGREYMEPLGYPAPGRAFRAGLRAGF